MLLKPQINPFFPNAPFLYPLKTSENRKVFGGQRKGASETNGTSPGNGKKKIFKVSKKRRLGRQTSLLILEIIHLTRTQNFPDQWLRNISFSENFVYLLNE